MKEQYDIIIIGAGPAGLMTAIQASKSHLKIAVLEKMYKPLLKLRISGKGRCNITNSADLKEFMRHFNKNGRFLKFAFSKFFNTDLLQFFEEQGISFKLERGGRYFPMSDDAMQIVNTLLERTCSLKIPIFSDREVISVERLPEDGFMLSVAEKNTGSGNAHRLKIKARKIVLAAGGKSYPGTGSSGSGFILASQLGHKIIPPEPSLVPIDTKGDTAGKLQGLSLKNVNVTVWSENRKKTEMFGEMLFTDTGVTGPVILTLSKTVGKLIKQGNNVVLSIDLKPALDHEKLDKRLLRDISDHGRQSFKSMLKGLLPRKLIPVFVEKLKISEEKLLSQLSSRDRKALKMLLKEFCFDVKGVRSFDLAIVTSGGVSIKEIYSHTMESKLVKGLYFAGEIIDVDADTGGYNLQAAFSTAFVAGCSAGEGSGDQ